MTKARIIASTVAHERFYSDVMVSALTNKLSDAETCALLSSIVGRMIGAASVGEDKDTITDTAIYNIQHGREMIPGLIEATGKGH